MSKTRLELRSPDTSTVMLSSQPLSVFGPPRAMRRLDSRTVGQLWGTGQAYFQLSLLASSLWLPHPLLTCFLCQQSWLLRVPACSIWQAVLPRNRKRYLTDLNQQNTIANRFSYVTTYPNSHMSLLPVAGGIGHQQLGPYHLGDFQLTAIHIYGRILWTSHFDGCF